MTFEKTIFSALNSQPFIIAEVGINHNGNLDLAKKTIESAHNAGASATAADATTNVKLDISPIAWSGSSEANVVFYYRGEI